MSYTRFNRGFSAALAVALLFATVSPSRAQFGGFGGQVGGFGGGGNFGGGGFGGFGGGGFGGGNFGGGGFGGFGGLGGGFGGGGQMGNFGGFNGFFGVINGIVMNFNAGYPFPPGSTYHILITRRPINPALDNSGV